MLWTVIHDDSTNRQDVTAAEKREKDEIDLPLHPLPFLRSVGDMLSIAIDPHIIVGFGLFHMANGG